ncbi:MAG: 16S rRNA (uracil(1498)-N(3))-methyltransferase [Spirochaetaceae bacterium]|jgi:16S rRNA (uracil1498-N3)-methyltransferase|nr:16S rRNA (uracil(1498)-N(3))-methyltransferase [Spirochaetaceae bacterium]
MKQFLLPTAPDAGGRLCLSGKDYHYLARVRRLSPGDSFDALLPSGDQVRVLVVSADRTCLSCRCFFPEERAPTADSSEAVAPEPVSIVLFQALPKGTRMDLIVRQATEGGVTEIVPFESDHSILRLTGETAGRLERWRRIVKEARQQSGSAAATTVRAPAGTAGALAYWGELRDRRPGAVGILLLTSGEWGGGPTASPSGGPPGQDPLEKGSFHGYLVKSPALVAVAIGPEGGFSPEEASRFMAAGFKPLTIGNTVLRTETAALYATAAIRVILLENQSWMLKTSQPLNG